MHAPAAPLTSAVRRPCVHLNIPATFAAVRFIVEQSSWLETVQGMRISRCLVSAKSDMAVPSPPWPRVTSVKFELTK
jgi:hypothetical protein